jgi:aspartokinase/homoserine dehydrogenase 1
MTTSLFHPVKRIDLILIGARGQVGRALRARLDRERAGIAERCGIDLRLLATFDRRGFAFDLEGLEEACIDEALIARTLGDAEALFRHRAQPGQTPTVVIDCTASDDIAQQYPDWLSAGLGVVTANKRGNARELSFYRRIQRAAQRGSAPYRFETTVGAAIPLLGPLRALALRGERVLAIQGVLSGSLSYLLQRLHAGDALSQSLADAQALGYTEPDAGAPKIWCASCW